MSRNHLRPVFVVCLAAFVTTGMLIAQSIEGPSGTVRIDAVDQIEPPAEIKITPKKDAKEPGAKTKDSVKDGKKSPSDKGDAKNDKKQTLSEFMREKLSASNKVLEGLTVEDYDLIKEGAAKLEKLSNAERWRASKDAMYRHHSVEFRRVVRKLSDAADKEDLDAAALAWVGTTMNCIECHKYVRTILVTGH